MIALAFILASTLLAALGLVGWLVYRVVKSTTTDADHRVAQTATEAELERAQFEREVTVKALAASNHRAQVLEEELADAFNSKPDDPAITPGDVRARVLRIARRWSESEKAQPQPDLPPEGER